LRATITKCHSPTGAAPHVYKDPEDERQRHRNKWFDRLDAIVELATCATDVVFTFVVLLKKAFDTAGKTAVYAGLFYASVSVLSLQLFLRLVMALYPLTYYRQGWGISWTTYGQGVLTTLVDPLYGIKLINKANLGQHKYTEDKIKGERQLQYSLLFAGILLLILEDIPELGTCTAPVLHHTCTSHCTPQDLVRPHAATHSTCARHAAPQRHYLRLAPLWGRAWRL
jgi:hypothetical protein